MSELSSIVGTGRADIIPGYTIIPRDIEQIAEAEAYFEALHRKSADIEAAGMDQRQGNRARQQADAAVASGLFSFGSPFFTEKMNKKTSVPFLLWINLKASNSAISFADAKMILSKNTDGKNERHENFSKIRRAILEMWEYTFGDETDPNALTPNGSGTNTTGVEYTNTSAESADTQSKDSAA